MLFNKNKIIFLTYGNNKFKNSRKRIIEEAKKLKIFTEFVLETDEKICNENEFKSALINKKFKQVFDTEKGGGCYIWKPYIIYKNLSLLNKNDILVYSDAGCSIPNTQKVKKNFIKYFIALKDNRGVLGFRAKHIESEMCKGDVFEYFGVVKNKEIFNTKKFSCPRHFIRKCEHSMNIYEKWWNVAKTRPDLFDGRVSKTPNYPNFFRHIWDTGSYSVLCKIMGVVDIDWNEETMPIKLTRIRN